MPFVVPEHYFLPLAVGVKDIDRPVGLLQLHIIGAKKVPKMDLWGEERKRKAPACLFIC